jgi:hypothetical protein
MTNGSFGITRVRRWSPVTPRLRRADSLNLQSRPTSNIAAAKHTDGSATEFGRHNVMGRAIRP